MAVRVGNRDGGPGRGARAGGGPRPRLRQDELIERTGPPALDDLETDANKDGVPDGWYNARDVSWVAEGGAIGPHFLRFAATPRAGRRGSAAPSASTAARPRRSCWACGSARRISSSASAPAPSRP